MKRILSATFLSAQLAAGQSFAAPMPDSQMGLCQILYDAGTKYLDEGRLEGVKRTIEMMGIVQRGCPDEAAKLQKELDDFRKRRELEDAPLPPSAPKEQDDGRSMQG